MKEPILAFSNDLSIGVLNCETLEVTRVNHVKQDHWVFQQFQVPFDWYWQGELLIIASQKMVPRANWHRPIRLLEQEIPCQGKYLFFFQYQKIQESSLLVTSLNLANFERIKQQLRLG